MFQPRNTLVVIELIEGEKRMGGLVIPTNAELYCEGIVTGVGPGNFGAAGARTETFDLKLGQRVLVQHQQVRQVGGGLAKSKCGIEYTRDGKKYMLFEQSNVLAIIAEPETEFTAKMNAALST